MRTILKLTATLYDDLVERLREPHDFAGERVGFLKCRRRCQPRHCSCSPEESIMWGMKTT